MSLERLFCLSEERKELVKWIAEHDNPKYLGGIATGRKEWEFYYVDIKKLREMKSIMETAHEFHQFLRSNKNLKNPLLDLSNNYFEGVIVEAVQESDSKNKIKHNKYFNVQLKDSQVIVSATMSKELRLSKISICVGDNVKFYSEKGRNIIVDKEVDVTK